MDCHRGMLPILLLLAFACQACEIEFSRSSNPLVGIDDIADMDGEFYVKWAHLVKNPSCVSRVEVKVDNRTKVDKSCDCANAPPKSAALKSYLDKILVSQPPGTPCAACKLTTIEVQLSNIEGNVLTVKKVVDPVKDLFDASKRIKIKGSEQGSIAIHWTEGEMFTDDQLKGKCLESVDVYNRDFLVMSTVTPENPILTIGQNPCTEKRIALKYNFLRNSEKPEVILIQPPASNCTETGEDKDNETVTSSKTTVTSSTAPKDETESHSQPADNDAARRREEDGFQEELPSTSTIGIGACLVVVLAFVLVGLLVAKKRGKENNSHKQVHITSIILILV